MSKKRVSKVIDNPSDVKEILELTHERASEKNLIMDWFGDFGDGPRFNPYDTINIPKGLYGINKKNKNEFKTTVGLWVFNKSFIEPFSDILGYINKTIDDGEYNSINNKLSYALLENKITVRQLKDFIMQSQIIMNCTSALCPSHTIDMMLLTTKVEKKKKQLEKQYADQLKNKDLNTIKTIEDDLIDYAKEELKDSESVDMYNSGARSNWGNNFKNMYLIKGAIKLTDGSYDYIGSSYMSGLKPEEFAKNNDAAIGGPYSRSQKTSSGGYKEKLFTRATQHIKVLPQGSDCGTKHYITVTLTKNNIKNWMYSFYINSNGNPVEITSNNADKLIGKTVKMRFSSLCKAKNGICECCAGTLFRRAGIDNAGLSTMVMMSSVKNRSMKAFHDSSLSLVEIDPYKAFSLKK